MNSWDLGDTVSCSAYLLVMGSWGFRILKCREAGATPKLLSLGIKKMGKETSGIISDGVCWKHGQLSLKHTKQFPENLFYLGAGAKNTKNGDFSALPRNCG